MSTPNPLVPEGSLQQSKGKSNVKIAVFAILGLHAVVLSGLLMLGCKDKPKTTAEVDPTLTTNSNDTASFGAPPIAANPADNTALSGSSAPITAPTTGSPIASAPVGSNTAPIPSGVAALPPTGPATAAVGNTALAPISDPVAPAGSASEHVIASGDTLGKVAKDNHVTLKALLEANPNVNPTKLKIGQKIQIPAPTATATASVKVDAPAAADAAASDLYVVKSGDVLERIAKSHGTSVKAIKTANNLKTDRLKVGQKLKLPAAKPTATAEISAPAESVLTPTPLTPSTTVASSTK